MIVVNVNFQTYMRIWYYTHVVANYLSRFAVTHFSFSYCDRSQQRAYDFKLVYTFERRRLRLSLRPAPRPEAIYFSDRGSHRKRTLREKKSTVSGSAEKSEPRASRRIRGLGYNRGFTLYLSLWVLLIDYQVQWHIINIEKYKKI